MGCGERLELGQVEINPATQPAANRIFAEINDTLPRQAGKITNERVGSFEFTPRDVRTPRPDLFQEDVVTAMDVIMTLGDQGKLVYTLQWYESIGSAGIVKNYFVDRINNDVTEYRCGFVYEAASRRLEGRGNHIHLPADSRVIFAPEYVEFFYICI